MKKNAATKWIVFAFDRTNNTPKTGDAANITADVYIDGGAANGVDDTNPAELGAGYYIFDITAAECNGDLVVISPVSSTSNVQVIGVPGAVWTDTLSADIAGLTTPPAASAIADAVWDEALSGHATSGTAGKKLTDDNTIAPLDAAGVRGAVGLAAANLDSQLGAIAPPAASAIADAVWDEVAAGHSTAGTAGKVLTDAGAAGTPLDAAGIRGAVGLATANLDTKLGTLALDSTAVSIKSKTDNLPASPAAVSNIPTAASVADAVWDEPAADHVAAGSESLRLSSVSPADIADAVWDELTGDHAITGSAGVAVAAVQASAYPDPSVIATAVWAKVATGTITMKDEIDTLYNAETSGAGAGSGAGGISVIITIESAGDPVDGAEVWVTTDLEGTDVVAGTLTTDAFGKVVFMLDAGTYFLWKRMSGINFTNPETIVVTA